MRPARSLVALSLLGATLVAAPEAQGFCGFYAGGAGAHLFNHATQVVLMREGQRTVLSMENDYDGPADGFAMVVPVPVVLRKDQVKTLSRELFERVDQLDAPRLVEYWERDPCDRQEGYGYEFSDDPLAAGGFGPNDATIRVRPALARVQVLNRFAAGEYQIVILGAEDSLALETWLRDNGYAIPPGAEAVLRPYVQGGMKFFVAKIDPAKVRFASGRATLSPLRFHYDAETFALPVRLGLLNSPGTQDLIVHILSRGQRYEVKNQPNATIPTNLDVGEDAVHQFGAFYASVFAKARADHPRTVLTEYAWDAGSCDPCPGPPLDPGDLGALGADVAPPADDSVPGASFVLTRLHARYTKDELASDLVFAAAPPIAGGREVYEGGSLEKGARQDTHNNFQGRYAVRHPWSDAIPCESPIRGRWQTRSSPIAAPNLAFAAPQGAGTASFPSDPGGDGTPPLPPRGACASCQVGSGAGQRLGGLLALGGALGLLMRRARRVAMRRRRRHG
jgi:hypothetical protein